MILKGWAIFTAGESVMGSLEPGSENEFCKKKLAGPLATNNKPPHEQNRVEKCERTRKKPEGPA